MAITTLLRLKNDGPLPLERACIMRITDGNRWSAAPCAHLRAPRREGAKMRAHTPPNCDRGQHKNRNRTPVPALLTFARIKRKRDEPRDSKYRCNQQKRRLEAWRKIGQNGIKPQEEEIRFRRCLNDRWIRLAARSVGAEYSRANGNSREDCRRKEGVLPH